MSELPLRKTTSLQTKVLTVFMIVALGVCVSVLSTFDTSSLLSIDRPALFGLGLVVQAAVPAVYVLAWQLNLRQCGFDTVSYHDSLLHCGIAFLGKYMPGKIAGLVMRGMAVHKQNPSANVILKATTIEQLAMVHAGFIVCCVIWSLHATASTATSFLTMALLSALLMVFPQRLIQSVRKLTIRFPRVTAALEVLEEDFRKTYFTMTAFMLVVWLLSGLSMFFVLRSFAVTIPFDQALLITTLSFLTGFFAVILPAGIGAREGALILLLSPYCNTLTAITVATLHRFATVTIDLIIGSYALQKLPKT